MRHWRRAAQQRPARDRPANTTSASRAVVLSKRVLDTSASVWFTLGVFGTTTERTEMSNYRVDVYIGRDHMGTGEFRSVESLACAVHNWQQNDEIRLRLSHEAQVALIQGRYYEQSWTDYRAEVLRAVEDGEYGDLDEIGTSDMACMIVGRAHGAQVQFVHVQCADCEHDVILDADSDRGERVLSERANGREALVSCESCQVAAIMDRCREMAS